MMKAVTKSEYSIAVDYTSLDPFQPGVAINLFRIDVLHYDHVRKSTIPAVRYKTLSIFSPSEFPIPATDFEYTPETFVSPVVFVDTSGIQYRVPCKFWNVLINIREIIVRKSILSSKYALPVPIFYKWDNPRQWVMDHEWIQTLESRAYQGTTTIRSRMFQYNNKTY